MAKKLEEEMLLTCVDIYLTFKTTKTNHKKSGEKKSGNPFYPQLEKCT